MIIYNVFSEFKILPFIEKVDFRTSSHFVLHVY